MTRRRGAHRVVPIGMLAASAAVPAIVLAAVWQYADANVPPPTTTTTTTLPPQPADELVTDLLSFRRHPMLLAERAADAEEAVVFGSLVENLTDEIGDGSCVQLRDGDDIVAEIDPSRAVIPASNQKLIVAAVALEVLGPDHRFRTALESVPPVAGVISGDVYLVGGGDPVLSTADVPDPLRYPAFNTTALEPLADRLVILGVTRIEGDIVGDGSRYDDEFRAPSWGDDITSVEAGPYDALLVNDGQIGNGNYGLNPNRAAARVFYDLLVARGVVVTGAAANETRPTDAGFTTLALVESLPLTDILVEMLHTSDDNTAELLVKEIGFVAVGEGTRQAGLDTIRATLGQWGVPVDGLALHDGSGLSRENRVGCATLAAIMADSPVADDLRDVLPVAGRDGTLAEQLLGTEAEGWLQAKTGTLTDVKALTGSQPAGDGSRIDFSLVLNGPEVDDPTVYEPVWKRLVALIDDYPIVIEPAIGRFEPR
jgi:D-alanyl-D-alanine carboxypeptidase/D-alanyl-D-alanine-endopeptidase (penicillin-binding protein 4)